MTEEKREELELLANTALGILDEYEGRAPFLLVALRLGFIGANETLNELARLLLANGLIEQAMAKGIEMEYTDPDHDISVVIKPEEEVVLWSLTERAYKMKNRAASWPSASKG